MATHYKLQTKNGFTLIELILYVGIASALLLIISVFLSTLLHSRIKNQAIAEIEQQGLQTMQLITQTIRNADAVISPTIGTSASLLSLDTIVSANNPTIFDIASNAIRIKEGTSLEILLTNSRIIASELTFQNLSRAGTPGVIRVQFTLTHINPEGKNEYNFAKTFIGSAGLRQP